MSKRVDRDETAICVAEKLDPVMELIVEKNGKKLLVIPIVVERVDRPICVVEKLEPVIELIVEKNGKKLLVRPIVVEREETEI